jgi:hypothetical protein
MHNFALLIGTILLLVADPVDGTMINEGTKLTPSVDSVIKSIEEAELAGGDVSSLVSNFNTALDMLDQSDKSTFTSCDSHNDCNTRASEIFMRIINDANSLKEQASTAMSLQKLMNLAIYAPITAFVTSIVGFYSFKAWKSHQVKKFLAMEIRKK